MIYFEMTAMGCMGGQSKQFIIMYYIRFKQTFYLLFIIQFITGPLCAVFQSKVIVINKLTRWDGSVDGILWQLNVSHGIKLK